MFLSFSLAFSSLSKNIQKKIYKPAAVFFVNNNLFSAKYLRRFRIFIKAEVKFSIFRWKFFLEIKLSSFFSELKTFVILVPNKLFSNCMIMIVDTSVSIKMILYDILHNIIHIMCFSAIKDGRMKVSVVPVVTLSSQVE